jgi:hypothetical protein
MKIPRVGAEFFYADWQTYMTKPIVAFPNFAKVPKKTIFDSKTTNQETDG